MLRPGALITAPLLFAVALYDGEPGKEIVFSGAIIAQYIHVNQHFINKRGVKSLYIMIRLLQ